MGPDSEQTCHNISRSPQGERIITPPLITVIVAVLNGGKVLDRCLTSIEKQLYPHTELIIMDGGSTDNTLSVINRHARNITYWESRADLGIYHAWNKALKKITGEWVLFLGADDFLTGTQALSKAAPHLIRAKEKEIPLAYGNITLVDRYSKKIKRLGKPWNQISREFRFGMPRHLPHTGVFHHSHLFKIHGGFDISFRVAGDYEFLLRVLQKRDNLIHFMEDITIAAKMDGGISVTQAVAGILEVARAHKKNGVPSYTLFWIMVYARALCRQWLKN